MEFLAHSTVNLETELKAVCGYFLHFHLYRKFTCCEIFTICAYNVRGLDGTCCYYRLLRTQRTQTTRWSPHSLWIRGPGATQVATLLQVLGDAGQRTPGFHCLQSLPSGVTVLNSVGKSPRQVLASRGLQSAALRWLLGKSTARDHLSPKTNPDKQKA